MWKAIIIPFFVLVCFILERVAALLSSGWFHPSLLVILIVFFNLFRGSQYSLMTAFVAGCFVDAYTVHPFGLNSAAFVLTALGVTAVKVSVYHVGSVASRVLIVFMGVCLYNLSLFVLQSLIMPLSFSEMFSRILLPQVIATTFLANAVFEKLKICALKLFA